MKRFDCKLKVPAKLEENIVQLNWILASVRVLCDGERLSIVQVLFITARVHV